MPRDPGDRVEVRRLASWFNDKFHAEVSGPLATERIFKRYMTVEQGGGPPDTDAIRAARHNIRYHLAYIGWLVRTRDFLAGDRLTYADLAAAAHLSVADYLGDVPWSEDEAAKSWYARVKSRPSFRPLLADTLAGPRAGDALRRPRLLTDPAAIKAALIERAQRTAFPSPASRRPDAVPEAKARLERFLADGAHGDMIWLETTAARRGSPDALWPDVRSVIMLGMNYGPDEDPLRDPRSKRTAARFRSMRAARTITS